MIQKICNFFLSQCFFNFVFFSLNLSFFSYLFLINYQKNRRAQILFLHFVSISSILYFLSQFFNFLHFFSPFFQLFSSFLFFNFLNFLIFFFNFVNVFIFSSSICYIFKNRINGCTFNYLKCLSKLNCLTDLCTAHTSQHKGTFNLPKLPIKFHYMIWYFLQKIGDPLIFFLFLYQRLTLEMLHCDTCAVVILVLASNSSYNL